MSELLAGWLLVPKAAQFMNELDTLSWECWCFIGNCSEVQEMSFLPHQTGFLGPGFSKNKEWLGQELNEIEDSGTPKHTGGHGHWGLEWGSM